MKRTRGCLIRGLLVLLSVLLPCAAIELAAKVHLGANALYLDAWSFRLSQPAPYQNAAYFSLEFIAESFAQPGGWDYGDDFILPKDYEGTWFHIRNQRRVTTDQPDTYQHTVYLFGGSTLYNSEVPDDYTVASYLQRMLNQTAPNVYRVENLGVTTVTSTQEVARLKTVDLLPGDVVILFHGVNDAFQGIYYGLPDGQMAVNLQQRYEDMPLLQRLRFDLWRDYSPTLSSVALFLYPYSLSIPEHLKEPGKYRDALTAQYERNLTEAAGYTDAAGAALIVMLQPNLFTAANPTAYETALMNNPYIVPPGVGIALDEGYTALREAQHPALWIDATDTFDGHGGELFLDYCHVTHEGNRLIAARLLDAIKDKP